MPEPTYCPHCNADLSNGRTIGVEIWGVYDGTLFWRCPGCGGSWHRWSPDVWPWLYEAAERYVGPAPKADDALKAWAESMGLEARDA